MNAEGQRSGYWDILLAYIREGHRAWIEKDIAYGVAVERGLGLGGMDGIRFMRYLEERGFIDSNLGINSVAGYQLAPNGLAFAEGLLSLDLLLAAQASAILAAQGPAEAEKKTALAMLRDMTIEQAVKNGVPWISENLPQLLRPSGSLALDSRYSTGGHPLMIAAIYARKSLSHSRHVASAPRATHA